MLPDQSPRPPSRRKQNAPTTVILTNYDAHGETDIDTSQNTGSQQAKPNPNRIRIVFSKNNQVKRVKSLEDASMVSLPAECLGRDEQGRIVLQNCNVVINTVDSQSEMGQGRTLSICNIEVRPKSLEELQAEKEQRERRKMEGKYLALMRKLDALMSVARHLPTPRREP